MSSPIYPKQPGFFEPLAQLHSTTWPLRQSATNCWITVCSWAAVHALMVTPCYTISSTKLACASSFCLIFLSPWSSSTKSVWKIVLKNWTCLSHCFFLWKKNQLMGEIDFSYLSTVITFTRTSSQKPQWNKQKAGHYRSIHFHDTNTGETSKSAKVFFVWRTLGLSLSVVPFCLWHIAELNNNYIHISSLYIYIYIYTLNEIYKIIYIYTCTSSVMPWWFSPTWKKAHKRRLAMNNI